MRILTSLFILLIISQISLASDVNVTMIIDETEISQDDQVSLQVKVSGSRNASRPRIKGIEKFEVNEGGKSSQISIVNGRTTVSSVFSYSLFPKNSGTFDIGPAIVSIGGKNYFSQQLKIAVKKISKQNKTNQNKYFYATATITDNSPYIDQQLVYTYRIFTRVSFHSANLLPAEFKGFFNEQIGEQKKYNKIINGISWQVIELKYLLIPTQTGILAISPMTLEASVQVENKGRNRRRRRSIFDNFFDSSFSRTKQVRIKTNPISLHVQELPLKNRPKDFSNLVGEFIIDSTIQKNSLKRGESTTLTIKVEGFGNASEILLENFSSDKFKVYDDKPSTSKSFKNEKLITQKVFKKAIVPQVAGLIEIPPVCIDYFNTSTEKYEQSCTSIIPLNVM